MVRFPISFGLSDFSLNALSFSPGRFFAISEIKSILAHILLNYDVQLENGSRERPPNFMLETSTIPSTKTKVMFRKIRKTSDVD